MNKKRILSVSLAVALTAALAAPAMADNLVRKTIDVDAGIGVFVDGEQVIPTNAGGNAVDVFASEGTTYLPVRAISNALGAQVSYDAESYRVNVSTLPVDDKAAQYLETYFDIKPMTGAVSVNTLNAALTAIFGEEAVKADAATVAEAAKAAVINCDLAELAPVYAAKGAAPAVSGLAEELLPYVAVAIDAGIASNTWNFAAGLDGETAAQLLMNAVNVAGKGRNYLGNVSDPDIGRKLQSAWATFGNFDDVVLSQLGADLVIAEASTGYNLKFDGYNANFLPDYTIQYGHSDITHALQLMALLKSEGIDAKVALEPKTSIYEYMVDWGDPTKVESTSTYALKPIEGTDRWLCYATEYDMMLEFDTVEDKNALDSLIETYSKKYSANQNEDGSFKTPLIAGAWWNPLYSSYVPMADAEAFTLIKDNVIRNGAYTIHPFSMVDDTDAIAKVVSEKAPDLAVELVDLYVNNAFYRYLNGEGE